MSRKPEIVLIGFTLTIPNLGPLIPGIWYPRKPWDRVEHYAGYYRLERWGGIMAIAYEIDKARYDFLARTHGAIKAKYLLVSPKKWYELSDPMKVTLRIPEDGQPLMFHDLQVMRVIDHGYPEDFLAVVG